MANDFYLAAVPDAQPVMLGRQLRPLSLGHLILLHRYGSNFVSDDGSEPWFDDLALSVLVCSMTYRQGISLMNARGMDRRMRRWHKRITGYGSLLVRLGWKKARLVDLHVETRRFAEYLRDNSKIPFYTFDPGDFREMDCPAVQHVRVKLMRDLHFREEELMDRPWSACLWDYVTLKACDGDVRMENRDDFTAAMEAAKKLQERIDSGQFKPKGGK